MTIDKEIEALRGMAASAWQADAGAAKSAVLDATRALKRIMARAETLPAEYERVEIVQSRGAVIEFAGTLLCETSFETGPSRARESLRIDMEVWRTTGGALVAVSCSTPAQREGREDCRALVVPPQDDEMAMRLAVMEHFGWSDRARSMVRKALGWSLKLEVE